MTCIKTNSDYTSVDQIIKITFEQLGIIGKSDDETEAQQTFPEKVEICWQGSGFTTFLWLEKMSKQSKNLSYSSFCIYVCPHN